MKSSRKKKHLNDTYSSSGTALKSVAFSRNLTVASSGSGNQKFRNVLKVVTRRIGTFAAECTSACTGAVAKFRRLMSKKQV
ncbi:hypothetical protein MTO96_018699 [Rhipicephalus appendiculatus]